MSFRKPFLTYFHPVMWVDRACSLHPVVIALAPNSVVDLYVCLHMMLGPESGRKCVLILLGRTVRNPGRRPTAGVEYFHGDWAESRAQMGSNSSVTDGSWGKRGR